MNQTDYAYGVSYIRSIENRLLDKGDVESLILTKTPEEAIRILTDKGYSTEPVAPADYERLLSAQLEKCWETVREAAPKGAPLDLFLYQNDFHNLKVVLKATFTGAKQIESLFLSPHTVDTDLIVKTVSNQDFSLLPDMLKTAAEEAYRALSRTEDSQTADVIIDKAAMDFMYESAVQSKSAFVEKLVRVINTLCDIKIAYRGVKTDKNKDFLEKALSDRPAFSRDGLIAAALGGEDSLLSFLASHNFEGAANALKNSVTEFEKYASAAEKEMLQQANYITFGIEPLIAYILKKQSELLTVRIIMSCKINGLSEEKIRERLGGAA